jgi:dTDP-4-amino-4,6-dideoxygalactose transaminase
MIKVSQGCLGEEELAAVREVFASGYFGHGPRVVAFENAVKAYLGAANVVAVNTGTSALHLALEALGIGPGDEVIVPSLTYVASFQAIGATRAVPVACEVDLETLQVNLADMEHRITPHTRALMPVHYAGAACDLEGVRRLAERYKLRVVEDAAHAFGSTYNGRKIGSFGDVACFSFDSIKNITCGEGGAVACQDADLAERMRQTRHLGTKRAENANASAKARGIALETVTQGFRYHMSSINAAIGIEQLKKVEGFLARRRDICRRYDSVFGSTDNLRTLPVDYSEAAPHIYVVRVLHGRRDALMESLNEAEIETGLNYVPNHLQPHFRLAGLTLPATEQAYREMLTLPLHCGLSDADVEGVIGSVQSFFKQPVEYAR